jgi:hypothetical protein
MDQEGSRSSPDDQGATEWDPPEPDPAGTRTSGIRELSSSEASELLPLGSVRPPAPPPPTAEPTRDARTGAWLVTVGGALALIGSLLHWAFLTFPFTVGTSKTVGTGHRGVGLVLGGLMVLRGVLSLSRRDLLARRSWARISMFSGVFLLGFVIFDLATERTHAISALVKNTAEHLAFPIVQVQAAIDRQVAEGLVRFQFGIGIYLTMAGAIIAIVGSALLLRATRR